MLNACIYAYLKRINYTGSLEPTLQMLQALHDAHLRTIPFENLDIHMGKKILLDQPSLWTKIVKQRRGGLCYEVNGLFAWLLRSLGFEVDLLSARVDGFDMEHAHLALLVHLEEDWLVDVGFGYSPDQPLLVQASFTQSCERGINRVIQDGTHWLMQWWNGEWHSAYRFTLTPHEMQDFAEACIHHETAPGSYFAEHRVCSIVTRTGRKGLKDQQISIKSDGEEEELYLPNQETFLAALAEHFGIILPNPSFRSSLFPAP